MTTMLCSSSDVFQNMDIKSMEACNSNSTSVQINSHTLYLGLVLSKRYLRRWTTQFL